MDAAELDRPFKPTGGKGKPEDEAKKQSKNRQRTKAKNRALVRVPSHRSFAIILIANLTCSTA